MNIVFLMEQNISIQEYYKIILYLYQLKNTLNVLVALREFIRENVMECQKKILKISLNQTVILLQFLLIIFYD